MNTRYLAPSFLMASLLALASPAATASDQLAGALLGAGAGVVLGQAVGGHDGAIVGGFLGAAVGASVADDDHRRTVVYRPRPYVVYEPAPVAVRYYAPPPVPVRYYAPPPPWAEKRYGHTNWRHDRKHGYKNRASYPEGPWDYRDW